MTAPAPAPGVRRDHCSAGAHLMEWNHEAQFRKTASALREWVPCSLAEESSESSLLRENLLCASARISSKPLSTRSFLSGRGGAHSVGLCDFRRRRVEFRC
ncbi:hypothetical protein MPTK1_8g02120 [Marchantia polymorpha subsp. ruderalis]|uniref:Uncharacterized protein n=1 Tax=Marchantia polymorpha TaxID=3197 RepID=A0A2R6XIY8_MARPO|nr:hypothetical protein MARPO_0012s0009 [Marchantia polymorpha]BBN18379.1 hypothetical protein Mp_8g02120 [Marchantia polymorpha subsp. ruderalis]|eukprot:PTQ46026.1 hypothetical protein MARPO_0012s0009 [Marchantia polymorpha]